MFLHVGLDRRMDMKYEQRLRASYLISLERCGARGDSKRLSRLLKDCPRYEVTVESNSR